MGASMVDYGKNLVILLRGHKADNAIAHSHSVVHITHKFLWAVKLWLMHALSVVVFVRPLLYFRLFLLS